jgi:hypothetical protein
MGSHDDHVFRALLVDGYDGNDPKLVAVCDTDGVTRAQQQPIAVLVGFASVLVKEPVSVQGHLAAFATVAAVPLESRPPRPSPSQETCK